MAVWQLQVILNAFIQILNKTHPIIMFKSQVLLLVGHQLAAGTGTINRDQKQNFKIHQSIKNEFIFRAKFESQSDHSPGQGGG